MANEVFGISAADAPRLKRLLDAFESGELHEGFLSRRSPLGPIPNVYIGRTESAISATVGSTFGVAAGSGTVSIAKLSSTDSIEDAGFDETAYTLGAAVSTGKFVGMVRDPFSGKLIVNPFSDGTAVRFQLTGTLALSSTSADAEQLVWSGSSYALTGSPIKVIDGVGKWAGISGNQGWAAKMLDRPKITAGSTDVDAYEIIFLESDARWIEFTMTENMGAVSPNESQGATVDDSWGDAPNGVAPSGTVTVHDRLTMAGSTIREFARALSGAKGVAVWNEQDSEYVIMRCQTKARFIRFSVNNGAGFASSDATVAATQEAFWDGQDSSATVVSNRPNADESGWLLSGLDGDVGEASYDPVADVYRITDIISSVGGDGTWISDFFDDGLKLKHLQPSTDEDIAIAGVIHNSSIGVICGLRTDDAGHMVSWVIDGNYFSPWGFSS